ncbi:hypothetical protein E2C01_036742 [Portunus trituberculatus]|uniref:Uncharacterized protein n=1 Tax=Portunus trituberculatus TaxID=210409 RepID=A0A5B7FC70_PORTR|nr:hypothetical protein [Portunus trituberculatus]
MEMLGESCTLGKWKGEWEKRERNITCLRLKGGNYMKVSRSVYALPSSTLPVTSPLFRSPCSSLAFTPSPPSVLRRQGGRRMGRDGQAYRNKFMRGGVSYSSEVFFSLDTCN